MNVRQWNETRALAIFVAWAFSCSAAWAADSTAAERLQRQRNEYSIALHAKLLCSGVFVIGREPEEFIANDLQREGLGTPGWDEIAVSVDRERRSVTLSMEGVPGRTAVFHGDQGCTLLPRGEQEVRFEPVKLRRGPREAANRPWPMGDLASDEPLPAEVNRKALEAALDFALDDSRFEIEQNTRAIVVLYRGRIVAERYAPGFGPETRHITWSMGKSITSALIGILIGEGHFKIDDPAPVAEWGSAGDPRGGVTIAHLLRMSSGLRFHTGSPRDGLIYTDGDHHRFVYFGATDVFKYSTAPDLEFAPNTVWRYRNCDPLTLGRIVKETVEARGEEYLSFPQRAFFEKLGMRNMVLEVDPWGQFVMTGFDYGTARDWARFGLLHLQDGLWQGERILPEGWVDFVRSPAPAHPNEGYGGLFWLNRGGRYKNLPRDMYWPAGHHGQVVMIVPSREMIVVRLGHSWRGGFDGYMQQVLERILHAVGPAEG